MTVRAAVHVHSDWSYDGSWTLPRLAEAFESRGYAVVLTAEHDRDWDDDRWRRYRDACAAASRPSLLLVPGIEYADPSDTVHVPTWGESFLGAGLETDELLDRVERERAFAVLAHPGRREAWRRFEPRWAQALGAIETWNRKYDGWAPGAVALRLADEHPGLARTVGLDFHTQRQFFPLALELRLDGPATVEGVLDALRERRFTSGVGRLDAASFASGPVRHGAASAEWARRRGGRVLRKLRVRA
jgi:hypothetical protein